MRVKHCLLLLTALGAGLCCSRAQETPTTPASSWEHVVASPLNYTLFCATFLSPDEGWAVGERGTILRYRAGQWAAVEPAPTDRHLFSVAFPTPQEGWAVGAWGTFLHYDGKDWQAVEIPQGLETVNLERVVFTGPDNGWAVGDSAGIVHYDGRAWQKVENPTRKRLYSLAYLPSGDAWAVGQEGTILHYAGQEEKWTVWPTVPTRRQLLSGVALSEHEVYAVGQGGIILRYDGKEWGEYDSPQVKRMVNFYFVASQDSGGGLWAFSTTRAIFHRKIGEPTKQSAN